MMLMLLLMNLTMNGGVDLYYDVGINVTPYIEEISLAPRNCSFRIDATNRRNAYYDGYAWYSGRIAIYEGNNMSYEHKRYVIRHEIGHICSRNNRVGTYKVREEIADKYAKGELK